MSEKVVLYEHNKPVFEEFKNMIENKGMVMLDSCPGSGKSYILLKYLEEIPQRILILCPKLAIAEEWKEMAKKYGIEIDSISYQKFAKLDTNYIDILTKQYDCFVFDECHHMGAPVWQINIDYLRKNYPDKIFIGLTATPIRYHDKQRDVGKEFFNECVVKGLSQIEAVEQKILPGYKYIAGLFQYSDRLAELKKVADASRYNKDVIYEKIRRLEECPENELGVYEAFDRYLLDKNRKGIVFVGRIAGVKYAEKIMRGYFGEDENYFIIHSDLDAEKNKISIENFKQVNHGWLFVVDMLNEGLHIPEIDTIVMLRNTVSPNLYIQQLGRSQSVGGRGAIIFDFMGNRKSLKIPGFETFVSGKKSYAEYKADPRIIVNYYETDALRLLKEIRWNLQKYKLWTLKEDNIIKEYYLVDKERCLKLLSHRTKIACESRARYLGIIDISPWTEKEDEILKEYYSTSSWEFLLKKLPNRSKTSCKSRAYKFGLKREIDDLWTEKEDEILKEYYPKYGPAGCPQFLPGRSKNGISFRAKKLGLDAGRYWNEEEENIVKEYYPKCGIDKCVELLPHRSESSVKNKVLRLGLKRRCDEWTEEEDDIIKEYYPKYGMKKCVELLSNRSETAIQHRVCRLGIKSISHKWTEKEDEILKKYFVVKGIEYCSELLEDRNFNSIRGRVRYLNIKKSRADLWTFEEDEILKEHYIKDGVDKCVELLPNRTISALKSRANLLGLKINLFWTEEEDDIVKEYYPKYGMKKCAELLPNRSELACKVRANSLCIYFKKNWTKEEDDFLIKNYKDKGGKYCADNLENRTYNSVRGRVKILGLTGQNKFQIPEQIDGYVYESIVQQYLMEHDFRHIMLTNKSGDYGVDIIVEKDSVKYAVQCKYWSKPVGIDAVRQVVTGKDIYDCDKCIVVTNNTFTKPAENLAVMHDVILMEHIDETNLKQPA